MQDNQKDLEQSTETLSEYLERDISAENLVDIKQKVQDKYRYGKENITLRSVSNALIPTGIATSVGKCSWTTCTKATRRTGGCTRSPTRSRNEQRKLKKSQRERIAGRKGEPAPFSPTYYTEPRRSRPQLILHTRTYYEY